MFTGLVETLAIVSALEKTGNGIRLSVKPIIELELKPGDSISVNGVCLTATNTDRGVLPAPTFDVSPETMRSTNLGELKVGDKVNLERALRLSDRLGGHIVTGHVDGVGTIKNKRQAGEYTFYTFEAPAEILRYTVKKGSITVDGISLTVVEVDSRTFSVAIIPHTLKATSIGGKDIGDRVNLEADIIGKYVEKFLSRHDNDKNLMELLKQGGFM
jgi:riboflavin synthase